MKTKLFLTGILSLALIFGMIVTGCKDDKGDSKGDNSGSGGNGVYTGTAYNGIWTASGDNPSMNIEGGNWTLNGMLKGTFVVASPPETLKFTITHSWQTSDGSWSAFTGNQPASQTAVVYPITEPAGRNFTWNTITYTKNN